MSTAWRDKWEVDLEDGLPQDWGDPQEEPEPRPIITNRVLGNGYWRYLIMSLTADEKKALVQLAEQEKRAPEVMGALLIRFFLVEMGLLPRGNYGKHER